MREQKQTSASAGSSEINRGRFASSDGTGDCGEAKTACGAAQTDRDAQIARTSAELPTGGQADRGKIETADSAARQNKRRGSAASGHTEPACAEAAAVVADAVAEKPNGAQREENSVNAVFGREGQSTPEKVQSRKENFPQTASGGADSERLGKRYRTRGASLTSKICKIAILTALATVLLLLEFPIFPATPFYQLNFSDVPVLIGTFMFGPWIGALISTLKVLLFFFFKGTSSGFVGEISNIVGGLAYAIPAGLIYGKKHGLKRAVVALAVGGLCFTVVMAFFNLFALLPWYAHRFMPELTGFRPRLILVLSWCVPFNLIKTVATGILTFMLYKATRKIFKLF